MSTVKDIAILCSKYLGYNTLADCIESGATTSDTDAVYRKEIVSCINTVVKELAEVAFPLVNELSITVSGGRFLFERLPDRAVKIYGLYYAGEKVDCEIYHDCVVVPSGKYVIRYSYLPERLDENDEIPFPRFAIDRLIAAGAAREFCIIHGRSSDSAAFAEVYEDELKTRFKIEPVRAGKSKARKWL